MNKQTRTVSKLKLGTKQLNLYQLVTMKLLNFLVEQWPTQVVKNGGHSIVKNIKRVENVISVNICWKRNVLNLFTLAPSQKFMGTSHMINSHQMKKLKGGTFIVLRMYLAIRKLLVLQLTQLLDGERINPHVMAKTLTQLGYPNILRKVAQMILAKKRKH